MDALVCWCPLNPQMTLVSTAVGLGFRVDGCHIEITSAHACNFRYLLLEDVDTGDMLMPLIYMKSVFEANYSRKLSSLKNRLVVIPSDQELSCARPNTYLYWQWAFESPLNVKLLVRQELGEENAPQASFSEPIGCSCNPLLMRTSGHSTAALRALQAVCYKDLEFQSTS